MQFSLLMLNNAIFKFNLMTFNLIYEYTYMNINNSVLNDVFYFIKINQVIKLL